MSRVAAQKTWQQIWIRPEVRPRANPTRSDPARVRARRRGRARRGNGTLARSATPPDESPPPPPPRPSLTSPLPSIAGVSHRRGDRQRGHALRVLLRPSDLQLSRLPVRPAPPTSESFTRDRGIDFHPPRARPSPRRGAARCRTAPRRGVARRRRLRRRRRRARRSLEPRNPRRARGTPRSTSR